MRFRLALLSPLALLAAFGSAGAQGPATHATAAASAWAIQIALPNAPPVTTPTASSPPAAAPVTGGVYTYPADGSVLQAQSTTASATTLVTRNAGAKSEAVVTGVSLFAGAITADAVTARASAGTGPSGAGGNANGSGVTNLLIGGQPAPPGDKLTVADWGMLTLGSETIDRAAGDGVHGYHGYVTELELRLVADHGGLPAGSVIRIGYAEAAAQSAPPPPATTPAPTTTAPTTTAAPTGSTTTAPTATGPDVAPVGDLPSERPKRAASSNGIGSGPLFNIHPKLTAGHYVFPVYGPTSYIDTFGAARSDVSYHHGDDIFGQLGQPLVACAEGTIFSVGWNKIGGNRLWIVDAQGNQYYYAHLSAFATTAVNGAHVKAGQVVGFMGHTGDAEGTPVHLHFEIHPVSLLYLGYDGAVDPTPYLDAWRHQQDLPFPIAGGWVPTVPGGRAPEPGAILLHMSDISTANGLDPSSLRRALVAPKPSTVLRALPVVVAPTHDLGKG
ncbi:MAG TPA: M23 family metallopeptidase [Gaiellaceae bacterium]|nr:M23 family metallopeptidase [Gaiellaceae bacterium]